jgi:tetraacyldisaccharide 4'-kinase
MKILLAYIYRVLYKLNRAFWLRPGKSLQKSKLVVVGSFRFGGGGKTPVCLELAKKLLERKYSVAILLHSIAWDEKRLYEKYVPNAKIFSTKNRAKLSLELDGQFDFLLCDDGFEDSRLLPNYTLLLDFGDKANSVRDLFPVGVCRSLKKDHLNVDEVWRCYGNNLDCDFCIEKIIQSKNYFEGNFDFFSSNENRFSIVCGLGDPFRFEKDLKKIGCFIERKYFFGDHSKKFEKRLKEILKKNENVVISEKDAMRLDDSFAQYKNLFVAKQQTKIQKEVLEKFLSHLEE